MISKPLALGWSALAAALVALVFKDLGGVPLWQSFLGAFCVVAGATMTFLTHVEKRHSPGDELNAPYKAMSLVDARTAAERALHDPVRFEVLEQPDSTFTSGCGLSPLTEEFFGRYSTISCHASGLELARVLVGTSAIDEQFTRIGTEGEHTEVAIRSGEESVYILADDVPSEEQIEDRFPTIYHFLAYQSQL